MVEELKIYDDDGNVICQDCMCHHTPGMNHVCPPWIKMLVQAKKRKEATLSTIKQEER